MTDLGSRRREYEGAAFDVANAAVDPFQQFAAWMSDAVAHDAIFEPTAATLATADADARPSARIVLLKGVDERGFVFYSNYESRKARDLAANPQAAMLFYWPALHRQARIEGGVERISEAESRDYFSTRPRGSQIAAWASKQSAILPDRAALEEAFARYQRDFENADVTLPPFWGGYRLSPRSFEFWQGRANRLHDRLRYTRDRDGDEWRIERLAP